MFRFLPIVKELLAGAGDEIRNSTAKMTASVTWILPDKLGGVNNFVANLLGHRTPDALAYHAILTRNLRDVDDVADDNLPATVSRVTYSLPPENLHSVLRRVAARITEGPGAIVANDWLALAMASAYRTGKAVVYVNHGDYAYYYDLAVSHQSAIDLFLTFTDRIDRQLRKLLPDRTDDILCIPYGVEIPPHRPRQRSDIVRLLYVGRLDRSKGVLDLPAIDRILSRSGIAVEWTIIGPGPAAAEVTALWGNAPHVTYQGRRSLSQVSEEYFKHDILVLPSRAEGLPVVLLEGMARGCVPVVSDLPSGIPEIVENGVTGFRVCPGDVDGFATAIASLDADRSALRSMSDEAAARIESSHNIMDRAPQYQRAITAATELTPRWSQSHVPYGSRLDQPWIPNVVVKSARSLRHGLQRVRRGPGDR